MKTAQFQWPDRMAWLATSLAALASAAGLFAGDLYRDNDAMIAQAKGTDLATLFGAVPALVLGLWFARKGSLRGRLVALGAIGYLVYCYAIYSFQVVISAATPLHIAILSLATWSLILGGVSLAGLELGSVGQRLPRRTSAGFLALIVVMFAALWLGQIAGAIASGVLPAAVADLDLPTSAVYTLDLAFALPLLGASAGLLVRGESRARAVAVASLVFIVLMALSILGLFAVQAGQGIAVDASMTVGFAVIAAIAAVLVAVGLLPAHAMPARQREIALAAR
jgi:membrane-associated HD superfamily phosphohydrolase